MTATIRTALYARISEDRKNTGASVERQRADCLQMASDKGWTVTQEYIDNSVSAYSGVARPEFERMLSDIRRGQFDAVVVYHQDRLSRRPEEFESFVSECTKGGVQYFRTYTGLTDLAKGDDLMVARIFSAVAANQSAAASRRIARKNRDKAERGLPHISGERAYGYEVDRMTVVEHEAEVIRTLAKRFVAGESLVSLTGWLQAQGEKTATGLNEWRTPTLRNLLKSPRIAGLREYQGEVIGPAAWPAIIDGRTHERIVARLQRTAERGSVSRTPRRYLLSGRVRCSLCGGKMVSSPDGGRRRYGCRSGPDFGGCGKVYVSGEALDRLVSDAVILRLSHGPVAAAISGESSTDEEVARLEGRMADDAAQLEELAIAYGENSITMREWTTARAVVEQRLNAHRQRWAILTKAEVLAPFHGSLAEIQSLWTDPEMTLSRQAAVVERLISQVTIHPASRKTNRLDPARVEIVWMATGREEAEPAPL